MDRKPDYTNAGYDQPAYPNQQVPVNYGAPAGYVQPDTQYPAGYVQPVNPYPAGSTATVVHVQPGPVHDRVVLMGDQTYPMTGHIVFSCVVYWCFNWIFGAIAFFVALSGEGKPAQEARRLGRLSMILNIVGISITIIVVAIIMICYFEGEIYVNVNK